MSKRKLLLADDSITIQKVVNLTFADEGVEVISVGDGNSAMEKFIEVSPDLVMADVNMPGVDGYRICEMIKQDEQTSHIPVILLVGSFEPFDEEEAKRVGADDYLTKPFQSIRQLVDKVSDLLDKPQVERLAFAKPAESEPVPQYQPVSASTGFADSGMDDEMIQTNQVGSLPVNEMQRFESTAQPVVAEEAEFPSEFRNVEPVEQQVPSPVAETKPLSNEDLKEIKEITVEKPSEEKQEVIYESSVETPSAQASVETFEQAATMPVVSDDSFVPTMIPTDQYFQSEESGSEVASQEVRTDDDGLMNETVREFSVATESEANNEVQTSQPGFIDKLRNIFNPKDELQAASVVPEFESAETEVTVMDAPESFEETNQVEVISADSVQVEEVPAQADYTYNEVPQDLQDEVSHVETDVAQLDETSFDFATPQPVAEAELPTPEPFNVEHQEVQPVEVEYSVDTFESDFAEPEIAVNIEPAVEEVLESPVPEETAFELVDTEPSTSYQPIEEAENIAQVNEAPVAEKKQPELEIIEPVAASHAVEQPKVEAKEQETKAKPIERKVIDLDEANLLEIAPGEKTSPIRSMISSELREEPSDTGENMIVSEYSRQSLSLSSEVIDMIADRVADKIAEKVIRELSSEVVSDLADLVVERMERKQLE